MQRTKRFSLVPWIGGINTSVDPGVLNPQDLVLADNVQFSATGARIKRNGLDYLDPAIPAPTFRSSSGTTRTLKWTVDPLVNISPLNERLVVGEHITVTGLANYNATDVPVLSRNSIPQVTSVTCIADVAGSLAGKYFLISAGDQGEDYYVWYQVSGVGVDPAISARSGIQVNISTGATASSVATATASAIDLEADFASGAVGAVVTITNAIGGITGDSSAGTSGFTVSMTTKGGHSITYTGGSSLSESLTAATGITISRASSVISITDYWRFDGSSNTQLTVYATDDFQLFKLDSSGRRAQIHPQPQITSITTLAAGSITTGDYFTIDSANDETGYYVWFNKDAGGGDPAIPNRTAVPVAIVTGDTAAQVATKLATALDALADFTASALSAVVTVTNVSGGISTAAADVTSGFTISVTTYGATAPAVAVSTVRTLVTSNQLHLVMSGVGNRPIYYNPDENPFYQLNVDAPDADIIFEHHSRVWMNDKTDQDKLHYSPPFNPQVWQGFDDSGAMFVAPGDGDPEGIVNGYRYKGFAVISKFQRRYRMTGDSPENYMFEIISEGLGNEGSMSIPVDETDVVFMSHRGIHSQAATDTYGDTDSTYLSAKIKPTFNTWNPERLKYSQGTWIPELNSIAISVSEQGDTAQNAVWLYNVEVQPPEQQRPGAWYRWPNVSCQALSRRYVDGQYKLVFGTEDGRVAQAQNANSYADFDGDGIPYHVKTGTIYVDNDPQTMKAFKRISLIYRPRGNFSFTVKTKIDNFPAQSFAFTQVSGLDLLGVNFVLGQSLLGSSSTLAPFAFSMDGLGRGISIDITQPTADEQIEIWGLIIEYEPAGLVQEVI